jgi:hypothetical protein
MHLLKNRVLAVAAGAAVVVGGADLTAYAAAGHGLLAGHHAGTAVAAKHSPGVHAYEYVIPKHTKAPFRFQAKDLPKGRYSVALSIATRVTVGSGSTEAPFCSVGVKHNPFAVFSYGVFEEINSTSSSDVAINTGSGLINLKHEGAAKITCFGADRTYSNHHSTNLVVFTPLSKVTVGHTRRLHVMASKLGTARLGR